MSYYQDPTSSSSTFPQAVPTDASSTTYLVPAEAPPAYTPGPTAALEPGYPPNYSGAPTSFKGPEYAYPGSYQSGAPAGLYPSHYPQQSVVQVVPPMPSIIVIGGCPACQVGILEDDFSCLAICCAVVFFPIGILCCLALKEKRCSNCGAVFG